MIIIVLIGALLAFAAPWIMRRRGAGKDWVQGNLLVTEYWPYLYAMICERNPPARKRLDGYAPESL